MLMDPISPTNNPAMVVDELALTQAVGGPIENASYVTRGYVPVPAQAPFNGPTPPVSVGLEAPRPAAVTTAGQAPTPAPTSATTVPATPTPTVIPTAMAPKAAAPTVAATVTATAPAAASGRRLQL